MTATTTKEAGVFDEMDVLARAQFLEGLLNAPPFKKIRGARGKVQLLRIMAEMASEVGGNFNPAWTSPKDTGLYRSVFNVVNKAIRSVRVERAVEAIDVMQSIMGLAGWEDEDGNTLAVGGKSPFWLAGHHVGRSGTLRKLTEGEWLPIDAVGLAGKLAYRRALDVLRTEALRAKKREEHLDEIVHETTSISDPSRLDPDDWGLVIDALLSDARHPIAKKFMVWVEKLIPQVMRRREGIELMTNYFATLMSGQARTDTEASRIIGVSPQALANVKARFIEAVSSYLAHNPSARDNLHGLFSDAKFYQDLMYGRVAARRVARRFFERRQAAKKHFKFKKDTKLKNGDVIPKGTPATVSYDQRKMESTHQWSAQVHAAYVSSSGRDYEREPMTISIVRLHGVLDGYPKPPNLSRLEKMSDNGIATTPSGYRVEPDGFGVDGSPSWLQVLGLI